MNRPEVTDFFCAQCGAPVGEPCRSPVAAKRAQGHATRQDKMIRARQDWQVQLRDQAVQA